LTQQHAPQPDAIAESNAPMRRSRLQFRKGISALDVRVQILSFGIRVHDAVVLILGDTRILVYDTVIELNFESLAIRVVAN
jgi:hypothetical protein